VEGTLLKDNGAIALAFTALSQAALSGNSMVNSDPIPSSLSTLITPP
jgi:hypothetical protein